jgi:hypothetical protein
VSLADVDTTDNWMLFGTVSVVGIPVDHRMLVPEPVTTFSPNAAYGLDPGTLPRAMSASLFVRHSRSGHADVRNE